MKRFLILTSVIACLMLATLLPQADVVAQVEPSTYVLKSSAFGGISAAPTVADNYSLVGASDPNAQQPLAGGKYSVASAHPTLLSHAREEPGEGLTDTLFIPAVER